MRNHRLLPLLLVVFMLSASSCAVLSIPRQINRMVNKVERKAGNYSSKKWKKSIARYTRLIKKYVKNYRKYSRDDKRLAMNSIVRYHSMLMNDGLKDSLELKGDFITYGAALKDLFKADAGAAKDFLSDVLGYDNSRIEDFFNQLRSGK